jgi:hypothetical protein
MKENSRAAKVVDGLPLKLAESDWQGRPFAARLAALEESRREYLRWKYGADPGFQRVYKIVKR